jgi:hypothetical protein
MSEFAKPGLPGESQGILDLFAGCAVVQADSEN